MIRLVLIFLVSALVLPIGISNAISPYDTLDSKEKDNAIKVGSEVSHYVDRVNDIASACDTRISVVDECMKFFYDYILALKTVFDNNTDIIERILY